MYIYIISKKNPKNPKKKKKTCPKVSNLVLRHSIGVIRDKKKSI
jgi:hypothetical protein